MVVVVVLTLLLCYHFPSVRPSVSSGLIALLWQSGSLHQRRLPSSSSGSSSGRGLCCARRPTSTSRRPSRPTSQPGRSALSLSLALLFACVQCSHNHPSRCNTTDGRIGRRLPQTGPNLLGAFLRPIGRCILFRLAGSSRAQTHSQALFYTLVSHYSPPHRATNAAAAAIRLHGRPTAQPSGTIADHPPLSLLAQPAFSSRPLTSYRSQTLAAR